MSARSRAALVALALVGVAATFAGESLVSAPPVLSSWVEDLHPLLGAAPADSFARQADADPWADFGGRRFARARGEKPRVLLVGGRAAVALAPRLEAALGGRAELVLAAREGYGTAQELILVARFAPVLSVSSVVALDGDELEATPPFQGWTREWDWQAAATEAPWGVLAAGRSALARRWLVRAEEQPVSIAERWAGYERRLGSVAALAHARGLALRWAFASEGRAPEVSAQGRAAGVRAIGARGEALASEAELVRALER